MPKNEHINDIFYMSFLPLRCFVISSKDSGVNLQGSIGQCEGDSSLFYLKLKEIGFCRLSEHANSDTEKSAALPTEPNTEMSVFISLLLTSGISIFSLCAGKKPNIPSFETY